MLPRVWIDTYDFDRIEKMLDRLPLEMQRVAFGRAAARTKAVIERQYARFASAHIKAPQWMIMPHLSSRASRGEVLLRVRSTNLPIEKFGVRAAKYGVWVRGRGRYVGNFFIPPATARRAAGLVLLRERAAKRVPTHRVFGPSPADAVKNNPGTYEELLSEIARSEFQTVILQQLIYLLSRIGR